MGAYNLVDGRARKPRDNIHRNSLNVNHRIKRSRNGLQCAYRRSLTKVTRLSYFFLYAASLPNKPSHRTSLRPDSKSTGWVINRVAWRFDGTALSWRDGEVRAGPDPGPEESRGGGIGPGGGGRGGASDHWGRPTTASPGGLYPLSRSEQSSCRIWATQGKLGHCAGLSRVCVCVCVYMSV